MAWETPVTNRTTASKYNFSDTNRVDTNTRYLETYIETNIGYPIILDAYTTQTIDSLPTDALINLLEGNINTLRDTIGFSPQGWQTLLETWEAGVRDEFIFSDANNLETDLSLLKTMAEQVYLAIRYCGQSGFYAGSKMTKL